MTSQDQIERERTDEAEAGRLAQVKAGVNAAYHDARDRAADGYDAARAGVAHAYESARDRASAAYASTREAAGSAGQRAVAAAEENPLGVLIGGIALGAIVGALIPRGEREIAALAPLGGKLRDAAATAGAAAKEQAKGKLAEFGVTDQVIDKAKGILDKGGPAAA